MEILVKLSLYSITQIITNYIIITTVDRRVSGYTFIGTLSHIEALRSSTEVPRYAGVYCISNILFSLMKYKWKIEIDNTNISNTKCITGGAVNQIKYFKYLI